MRRVIAGTLALSIVLAALPSLASEADAKDLFARGRELRSKGDCAGAVPLFRKSFELYPQGLGSLRNLAECEEQLGHFASSRRAWLDLKRALLVSKDSKYEGWDADADAAAARLAPKVARLTITVTEKDEAGEGPLTAANVRVLVNGETIDPKLLEVPLDRDPGSYAVRIEGGKSPVEQTVQLSAGENKSVKLVVELPPTPAKKDDGAGIAPSGPVVTPVKPETPSSAGSMRTAGYVALGIGGVAAIGAGAAGFLWLGARADLDAQCPNGITRCPAGSASEVEAIKSRGDAATTWTRVLGAVAVVGVGVGVVLLVTSPSKSSETKTTVKLSPWAAAGGGGAFLTGEF